MNISLQLGGGVTFDGERITSKHEIEEIIEVVEQNTGTHWGSELYRMRAPIESVFQFKVDGSNVSIGFGSRFLQLNSESDCAKSIWTSIYKNSSNFVNLGKVSPPVLRRILAIKTTLVKERTAEA